ncbi:MAG TPA: Fe-S cluster assembly protein SufD, partial [Planctomycetaceae bacterium]|nr:Fe-S cluster assembly protein SufD [Planctomycetaceae bacterium]
MTTLSAAPYSTEEFEAFLDRRDEPTWLIERRRAAWRHFLELDWPSRSEEEWMRTDIRMFHPERYSLPGSEPTALEANAPTGELALESVAGRVISLDSLPLISEV